MDRKRTGEVESDPEADEPQPARFALLRHDWPEPHRDLVLEWPGEQGQDLLATWALYPENPGDDVFSADRPTVGRVVPLSPHRAIYLNYEGPVSGNRGHVSRECAGAVVRAEGSAGVSIDLRFERAGGLVEGTLRIGQAASGEKSLTIRVSHKHQGPAAAGMVFAWEPTCRSRLTDEGSEAETQGR
jgi:hypothetical protein